MNTAEKTIAPPTLEQADAKIMELEAQIQSVQQLEMERSRWVNYRLLLLQLTNQEVSAPPSRDAAPAANASPDGAPAAQKPISLVPPKVRKKPSVTTVDFAEFVLMTYGPKMHLLEIVRRMRDEGWECTKDDHVDKGRVYSALHRDPEKFEKVGVELWRLKNSK